VHVTLNRPTTVDLAGVAQTNTLHHCSGPKVVAQGAGHDCLHIERVERVAEAGRAALRCVTLTPAVAAKRPPDLEPARVRPERALVLVCLVHPR